MTKNTAGHSGGMAEALIFSLVRKITGSTSSPCIMALCIFSAARQMSSIGMSTEVSEGLLITEMSVLSYPVSRISSGTRIPRPTSHFRTPRAIMSDSTTMASGKGTPESSSFRQQSNPPL